MRVFVVLLALLVVAGCGDGVGRYQIVATDGLEPMYFRLDTKTGEVCRFFQLGPALATLQQACTTEGESLAEYFDRRAEIRQREEEEERRREEEEDLARVQRQQEWEQGWEQLTPQEKAARKESMGIIERFRLKVYLGDKE